MTGKDPLKAPLTPLYFHYAIPTVLGMLASISAMLTDAIFVGNFVGPDALGALNMVWPLINIGFGLYYMIVVGGCASIGNLIGAGKREEGEKLFTQIFILIIFISILLLGVSLFFKNPLLHLLELPPPLFDMGSRYFSIITGMLLFFGLNIFFAYSARLAGKPKVYGGTMMASSLCNIILDALFVGLLKWGIEGAAWATGLSQLGGLGLALYVFGQKDFALRFKKTKMEVKKLGKAVYNGISELLTEASASLTAFVINIILIKSYGADGVTAFGILQTLLVVAIMAFYGFAEAGQPLVSQNCGAKQPKRMKIILRLSLLSCLVLGLALALFSIFGIEGFSRLFLNEETTQNENIRLLTKEFSLFFWPTLIFMGVGINFSSFYTAVENPLFSLLVSLSRTVVFPLLSALILFKLAPPPFFILGFPLGELLTIGVCLYFWKKSKPSLGLGQKT